MRVALLSRTPILLAIYRDYPHARSRPRATRAAEQQWHASSRLDEGGSWRVEPSPRHHSGLREATARSGRWDSNPRHLAWEASALPTELRPRGPNISEEAAAAQPPPELLILSTSARAPRPLPGRVSARSPSASPAERQPEGLRLPGFEHAVVVVEAVEVVGDADRVRRERMRPPPLRRLRDHARKLGEALHELALLRQRALRARRPTGRHRPRCAGSRRSARARTGRSRRGSSASAPPPGRCRSRSSGRGRGRRDTSGPRRRRSRPRVVEEDDVAATLGHASPPAARRQVDELVQEHLDARQGRSRAAAARRLQPRDVAVVVGAEHVDGAVEAAVELVEHVCDVGREVEVAARPTSGRAAGPCRRRTPSCAPRASPRPRRCRAARAPPGAPARSSALAHHVSKWMRKRSSVASDLAPSIARHRVALARCELRDVRAAVAVLGRLLAAPPRLDRLAEEVDLRARRRCSSTRARRRARRTRAAARRSRRRRRSARSRR